ncbi:PhzF family phenazine biosynthesis protein [Yoonia sp. R2331]|uniref:PhzF family phenazine biosynthesis protein n=1 Tax=Yoonia sp. R2331 TaxID=3237238 RepID=UPI0034E3F5B0
MTQYLVYDVFTDRPFGGNQLAVFPDATGLSEDQLQAIAVEFKFSEITLVYPPEDPAHTAKVRIFTPTQEIDFAGHPTIGTAIALYDLGRGSDLVLELGVGPIACTVTPEGAAFTTTAPLSRLSHPDPALVARALGTSRSAISATVHGPVQASLGLPFVIVELTDRAALAHCQPDIAACRDGAQRHPAGLDFAIFAYVREGAQVDARMFAPLDNIPEDPATGSACATLAALLHEDLRQPQTLHITQGEDMGRTSRITAQSHGDPVQVTISGQAVRVMDGRLLV